MKLLVQDKPQCLLYAFAMALDHPVQQIIDYLEHDGMEVVFPHAPKPQCYRGFHHQEFVDYCLWHGIHAIMVEGLPCLGYRNDKHFIWDERLLQSRMDIYLKLYDGVLVSDRHAVAWCKDEQKCYDPNGLIYGVDRFEIREFFILAKGDANEKERQTRLQEHLHTT
jgi:hypothetical protein